MVTEKYKPSDDGDRQEEEAMLREMFDNGFLQSEDFVRFGPPNASRMFLKEELTKSSRPYRYPEDVEADPEYIETLYRDFQG
jgi:hypothetical protein